MRILFTALTLCFTAQCLFGQSQYPKNDKGQIEFIDSALVKLSKDQLFSNFKKWIALEFKDSKDDIIYEDKESGIEIANLRIPGGHTLINNKDISTDITLMISVKCRDNGYKYNIKNVLIHGRIFEPGGFPRFYNDTPYRHYTHIDEYNNKINVIKSRGNLSGRDQRNLSEYIIEIQREKDLFESEYASILKCIENFKAYMVKTDI